MNTEHGQSAFCPVFHKSVELIGRRWTGAIIRAMRTDRSRFSDIAHAIPGLSDRLLSERLKELELEGIISRTVIPETPVRIEYHLTEKGRDLEEVMVAISEWASRWAVHDGESPVSCGGNERSCPSEASSLPTSESLVEVHSRS